MSNFILNIQDNNLSFENDLTEAQFERCLTIIKLYDGKPSKDKLEWPLFKVWFEMNFTDQMPYLDLKAFFTINEMYGHNPVYFGKILMLAIKKFFTADVTDRAADSTGLYFYFELNNSLSNGNALQDVILTKRAMSYANNTSNLEVLAKELNIIGYYIPEIKRLSTYIFCSNLPRNEVAGFLKALNCYKADQKEIAATLEIKKVYYKYKEYKEENITQWGNAEVHAAITTRKKCYNCGKAGHLKKYCRSKKNDNQKKAESNMMIGLFESEDENDDDDDSKDNEGNCHMAFGCKEEEGEWIFHSDMREDRDEIVDNDMNEDVCLDRCYSKNSKCGKGYVLNASVSDKAKKGFLIDSGASIHIVNDKNMLSNVKNDPITIYSLNKVKKYNVVGNVEFKNGMTLNNAVYIKNAPRNIISLTTLNYEGYDSDQKKCICTISKDGVNYIETKLKNKLYIVENNKLPLKERSSEINMLNIDDEKLNFDSDFSEENSSSDDDDAYENAQEELEDNLYLEINEEHDPFFDDEEPDWLEAHIKYGHASKSQLKNLGFKVEDDIKQHCITCAGNVTRTSGTTDKENYEVGEQIHADLIGPIYKQYGLVCIDNKTKFIVGYVLNRKSEASEKTIEIITKLNNLLKLQNKSVCSLKTDNEFNTKLINQYCKETGISLKLTAPHSSYQNGTAENANRIVKHKMKLLLFESGLPKFLWIYAFQHAIFLLNYIPRNKNTISPWKMFTGKDKNIKDLLPFGCLIFYFNFVNDQKIFTEYKSGIFIGYDNTIKIALIYETSTEKIIRSSAFQGMQHIFPLRKHTWYNQQSTGDFKKRVAGTNLEESSLDILRNIADNDPNSNSHTGKYGGSFISAGTDSSNSTPPGPILASSIGNNSSQKDSHGETDIEIDSGTDIILDNDSGKKKDINIDDSQLSVKSTSTAISNLKTSEKFSTRSGQQKEKKNNKVDKNKNFTDEEDNEDTFTDASETFENPYKIVANELIKINKLQNEHNNQLLQFQSDQNDKLINQYSSFLQQSFEHSNDLLQFSKQNFKERPTYIPVESGLLNYNSTSKKKINLLKDSNKDLVQRNKNNKIIPQQSFESTMTESDGESSSSDLIETDTENFKHDQLQLPTTKAKQLLTAKSHSNKDLSPKSTPGPITSQHADDNQNILVETPITDVTVQSSAIKIPSHIRGLTPSIKRYQSPNNFIESTKRRVQEGDSFTIQRTTSSGETSNFGKITSKVYVDVNNPERNKVSAGQRASAHGDLSFNQNLLTSQVMGGNNSDTNNNFNQNNDVDTMNQVNLLVNKMKYKIPETYKEAMKTPQAKEWKKAAEEEYQSMIDNNVFKPVQKSEVPKSSLVVKSRWVCTVKQEGLNDRFKMRIVAKGFTQEIGVNYVDKYAPVMRFETLRLVFNMAALNDWKITQLDAKNAFLNGKLDYEVYLQPPEGTTKNKNIVWKLDKSLYGLKQSPRIWFLTIEKVLRENGFVNSTIEPCLFWKKNVLLILYVDDILITGKDSKTINQAAKVLKDNFVMKELGKPKIFLGITIKELKDNRGYSLSMEDTIMRLQKDYNIEVPKRKIKTPLSKGFENETMKSEKLDDKQHTEYRSIIGSLLFLANTVRLDISFAVSYLSRFLENPTTYHLKGARRTLQYTIQTKNFSINYFKRKTTLNYQDFRYIDKTDDVLLKDYPPISKYDLVVVSDSDWAGDIRDRKSQSGNIVLLNGNIINWRSNKQDAVATSSTESEYMALHEAIKSGLHFKILLNEMKIKINYINLVGDNCSALTLGAHNTLHKRTKHIDIKYHFIRSLVERKEVKLNYINTKENIADILTKILDTTTFENLIDLIK